VRGLLLRWDRYTSRHILPIRLAISDGATTVVIVLLLAIELLSLCILALKFVPSDVEGRNKFGSIVKYTLVRPSVEVYRVSGDFDSFRYVGISVVSGRF
jgi:hypothetical protein